MAVCKTSHDAHFALLALQHRGQSALHGTPHAVLQLRQQGSSLGTHYGELVNEFSTTLVSQVARVCCCPSYSTLANLALRRNAFAAVQQAVAAKYGPLIPVQVAAHPLPPGKVRTAHLHTCHSSWLLLQLREQLIVPS